VTPSIAAPLPAPALLAGEDLTVMEDRFVFVQAERGWRFGFDSVLLARRVFDGPHGDAMEVGAGCGVISVLLAGWGWSGDIVAVEVQPALADRAARNVLANGVGDSVTVLERDIRDLGPCLGSRRFARVFGNPPFHRVGSGRLNPDGERAAARHELLLDMETLLAVTRERLLPDAVATFLYPVARMPEIRAISERLALGIEAIVEVLPGPDREAELVLVDLRHGPVRTPGRGVPIDMRGRRRSGAP